MAVAVAGGGWKAVFCTAVYSTILYCTLYRIVQIRDNYIILFYIFSIHHLCCIYLSYLILSPYPTLY